MGKINRSGLQVVILFDYSRGVQNAHTPTLVVQSQRLLGLTWTFDGYTSLTVRSNDFIDWHFPKSISLEWCERLSVLVFLWLLFTRLVVRNTLGDIVTIRVDNLKCLVQKQHTSNSRAKTVMLNKNRRVKITPMVAGYVGLESNWQNLVFFDAKDNAAAVITNRWEVRKKCSEIRLEWKKNKQLDLFTNRWSTC